VKDAILSTIKQINPQMLEIDDKIKQYEKLDKLK